MAEMREDWTAEDALALTDEEINRELKAHPEYLLAMMTAAQVMKDSAEVLSSEMARQYSKNVDADTIASVLDGIMDLIRKTGEEIASNPPPPPHLQPGEDVQEFLKALKEARAAGTITVEQFQARLAEAEAAASSRGPWGPRRRQEPLINETHFLLNTSLWNTLKASGIDCVRSQGYVAGRLSGGVELKLRPNIMFARNFKLAEKIIRSKPIIMDRVPMMDILTVSAVCGHWVDNRRKPFTPLNIYQRMGGGDDLTPETCAAIRESIETWWNTTVSYSLAEIEQLYTRSRRPLPPELASGRIKSMEWAEHAFSMRRITIEHANGAISEGYELKECPFILAMADESNRYITLPQRAMALPGRWSPEQAAIEEDIITQIYRMNGAYRDKVQGMISSRKTRGLPDRETERVHPLMSESERKIRIDTMLDRLQINSDSPTPGARRKRMLKIREMMQKALDHLADPQTEGGITIRSWHWNVINNRGEIDGAIVDLFPPEILVKRWERLERNKVNRIRREITKPK